MSKLGFSNEEQAEELTSGVQKILFFDKYVVLITGKDLIVLDKNKNKLLELDYMRDLTLNEEQFALNNKDIKNRTIISQRLISADIVKLNDRVY